VSTVGVVETELFRFGSSGDPFVLESGATLPEVTLAYETYGQLSEGRDNAVLVFHALSGSAHAAGFNAKGPGGELWTDECHVGWWDTFIGPGRVIDTEKFFVVCANYLGSCYGSTGPTSIDPRTGKRYAGAFPDVTIGDIVRSQMHLLDHLGIEKVLAVMGGSLGGLLAQDMAARFPGRVDLVVPIASGLRVPILTRLFTFEQIFALQEDPNFNRGDYYDQPEKPWQGVVLARMISHKTFVHLEVMEERARGHIVQADSDLKGYRLRHRIESYMLHQGKKFAKRFDANSYVKILTAWQTFDMAKLHGGGDRVEAYRASAEAGHRYLIFTVDSDVCFWPEEQAEIVEVLKAVGLEHHYITVHSDKGHDSFLLEPDLYRPYISYMLDQELIRRRQTARRAGKRVSFMPEI
jgi:homoserine O-acetyltransferase